MSVGLSSLKGTFISLLLIAAVGAWALSKPEAEAANSAQAKMLPPPAVEAMTVMPSLLRIWTGYSGKFAAVETVDIKPLLGGGIE